MSSTTQDKVTWKMVILTLIIGVIIPISFILYAANAVDAGDYGGKPGYASGNGVMVWLIDRLHVVIIGAFFGFMAFISLLVLKILN